MNDMRRRLIDLDVAGARKLWAEISPHLPQPKDDAEALATLHHARTSAASVPEKLRAYSHRWLLDRGLPSGLPDDMRPKAERLYPVVVEGVGVAVTASSDLTKPIVPLVRDAMSAAVEECYADGNTRPETVRARMMEARAKAVKGLLGVKT